MMYLLRVIFVVSPRFNSSLKVLVYAGTKDARSELADRVDSERRARNFTFDVLLTTYEICMRDDATFRKVSWGSLVVDEGHRLKNIDSLLYKTLEQWDMSYPILLTGTPVQNNLRELYALLSFIDCTKFKPGRIDRFVDKYSKESQDMNELHDLMDPYFLRRTKAQVLADLPEKTSVVLYHGLSQLQKKLYKAILTKDIGVFEKRYGGSQTSMNNILMQLRKLVNHPYLFEGVEPEPFETGEHLVEASHKLTLIDRLLASLHAAGHKVLMFSQMTRMLDVLQDYLTLRGYSYERLDGSVRGEERFMAVKSFNETDDTFVFLLSTKAGGQGLNLTSADTVIFIDSDFNPQNDLQAAARAHRIGQGRPVKIIRLIGRHTVEEIILRRAEEKLKLTEKVIEEGKFASMSALTKNGCHLEEILKFGVESLLTDATADDPVDFDLLLGRSKDGEWVVDQEKKDLKKPVKEEKEEVKEEDNEKEADSGPSMKTLEITEDPDPTQSSMYMFEGRDYSKEPSAADLKAFEQLIQAEKEALKTQVPGERLSRTAGPSSATVTGVMALPTRKPSKPLTPEEMAEKEKKKQEAAEKRAIKVEEQAKMRAEAMKKKREALWKENSYNSLKIEIDENDVDEDKIGIHLSVDEDEEEDGKSQDLNFVIGDVTRPRSDTGVNIIVHCTDDSGYWGKGGLFSALGSRSGRPQEQYEMAGQMKDLSVGDCHLMPLHGGNDVDSDNGGDSKTSKDFVALIVAQSRDKGTNQLSGIKLSALSQGLQAIYRVASDKEASVHLPRIGHDTPKFNWYGTERLLRKHLCSKGVPTYVYYYKRKQAQKRKLDDQNRKTSKASKHDFSDSGSDKEEKQPKTSSSLTTTTTAISLPASKPKSKVVLHNIFTGLTIHFHKVSEEKRKELKRYIITYDGDVSPTLIEATTHVVTEEEDLESLQSMVSDMQCCVVTTAWVTACVVKRGIVDTDPYTGGIS